MRSSLAVIDEIHPRFHTSIAVIFRIQIRTYIYTVLLYDYRTWIFSVFFYGMIRTLCIFEIFHTFQTLMDSLESWKIWKSPEIFVKCKTRYIESQTIL